MTGMINLAFQPLDVKFFEIERKPAIYWREVWDACEKQDCHRNSTALAFYYFNRGKTVSIMTGLVLQESSAEGFGDLVISHSWIKIDGEHLDPTRDLFWDKPEGVKITYLPIIERPMGCHFDGGSRTLEDLMFQALTLHRVVDPSQPAAIAETQCHEAL